MSKEAVAPTLRASGSKILNTTAAGIRPSLDGANEAPRAEFACIFCKRRKIKCDRALPLCSLCKKAKVECEYPLEAAKPGPKVGTTRRKRARSRSPEKRQCRPIPHERNDECEWEAGADTAADSTLVPEQGVGVGEDAKFENQSHLSPNTPPLDVRTLAYIMHPSHDVADVPPLRDNWPGEDGSIGQALASSGTPRLMGQACAVLKIPTQSLWRYINLYFDNILCFSLFHRPSFQTKLRNIKSENMLVALLASMFSFVARFKPSWEDESSEQQNGHEPQWVLQSPQFYESLSEQYVEQAMSEFSSEVPPLALLQSLVLLTFQQLIKGVRGSAWRRLGVCVRAAYELNLHRVDVDNTPEVQDMALWCEIEERRRTWWAIWEMDAFASTIKRCASGIDPTDNMTRLPVSDEHWFNGTFHPSCFLEAKPVDRLKSLQQCGNNSTKAWYIVLNSYTREGQVLSKFRSPRPTTGRGTSSSPMPKDTIQKTLDSIGELANALRCFTMALPKRLRYRDEYLSFSSRDTIRVVEVRQQHHDKYSIHVMTQLARIMIHHHNAFLGAQEDLQLVTASDAGKHDSGAVGDASHLYLRMGPTRKGLQQYIDAADELLRIVSQSAEEHVRYVNPFLASTIWYGAAVHRAWEVLSPPQLNHDYIASKFEVMRMTFNNFSSFWELPHALQDNLNNMKDKLKPFAVPKERRASFSSYSIHDRDSQARDSQARGTRSSSRPEFSTSLLAGSQTTDAVTAAVDDQRTMVCEMPNPHRPPSTNTYWEPYTATEVFHGNGHVSEESKHIISPGAMGIGSNSHGLIFDTAPHNGESFGGQGDAPSEHQSQLELERIWDDILVNTGYALEQDALFQALSRQ